MFRTLLRLFGPGDRELEDQLPMIAQRRQKLSELTDNQLKSAARVVPCGSDVVETFALVAVVAERVLGLRMFEVQIRGALALQRGYIAEMKTGEGKTLAAVPTVIWYARQGRGTHVLTANDYLARRDAIWMRGIYDCFGLSVAFVSQSMPPEQRRAAYLCDVTYATANEVGFDYLRDGLARRAEELRAALPFSSADQGSDTRGPVRRLRCVSGRAAVSPGAARGASLHWIRDSACYRLENGQHGGTSTGCLHRFVFVFRQRFLRDPYPRSARKHAGRWGQGIEHGHE